MLAAVFETFVPGSAIRRANLAATTLDAVADPDDIGRLRSLLGSFDSRSANLALGLGPVRFRDLSGPRREQLLRHWATSRIGQRRTAYQTLKRLACFLAYADPGPEGANPLWSRIGYRLSDEPTTARPPAVSLVKLPDEASPTLHADVVVVGSGAGGGLLAAALAEAGRDVLVVEAGSYVAETAMSPLELDGLDRMYLDHGLASTADLGIAILAGATLGGGTTVNWATAFLPPDELRREWTNEHGLEGFDGPETTADLDRLQGDIGFDLPPSMPPKDQLLLAGAAALGWEAGPMLRGASDCGDCGACAFGCRRAAKRCGPRLHLAAASASGARILVDAPVDRVLIEDGRAAGVSAGVRGADGAMRPVVIRARQVVVAAGAMRTPALLQASDLGHPAIGQWLRLHPVPVVVGRFPGIVDVWRGTMQGARSLEFRTPGAAQSEGPGPAHGGFIIESAPAHPGLIALAYPWEGTAEHRAAMERARSLAPFIAIVRDRGAGRVQLGRSGRVRVDYQVRDDDARTARRALIEMARLARAAGAREVIALGTPAATFGSVGAPNEAMGPGSSAGWDAFLQRLSAFDFTPNRGFLFSAHQMGSARAGRDPRTTACDPWGRVRADASGRLVPSLYVADASLFPTASGVNPMVTVMALAWRVVRTVLAEAPAEGA